MRGALEQGGVVSFKGIPYAAPPIGALRWRPPMPAARWTGERDASHFGPRCLTPTGGPLASPAPSSENCLTINVWAPDASSKAKRPVMVWIHGGGFQFGSSQDANTDGTVLARKGVVVVEPELQARRPRVSGSAGPRPRGDRFG